MLRAHPKLFFNISKVLDIAFMIASFILSIWLYDFSENRPSTSLETMFRSSSYELAIYIIVWIVVSSKWKIYYSKRIIPILKEAATLIKASFISITFAIIGIFILRSEPYEINHLLFFWCINVAVLISFRVCLRKSLRFIRAKGYNNRNIVLVGRNKRAAELANGIIEEEEFGLKLIGYVDETSERDADVDLPEGLKLLGDLSELTSILNENIVDEVFIALPIKTFYTEIESVISLCTERGVGVRFSTDMFFLENTKHVFDRLGNIPLLNISLGIEKTFGLFIKRVMDILIAGSLFILMIPLFIAVSILIVLDSKGTVFYVQERVGRNNRRFKLLKFRTMVMNADEMKADLTEMNEMDGPVFKMKKDPRITRAGKYLRRLSMDELPQLLNVLKGDMSLVGPRPPLQKEVEEYTWKQRRRLSIKPGITGPWQVSGRNKVSFEEWVKMDLEYVDNWKLGTDFKILIKTVYTVLSGKGVM